MKENDCISRKQAIERLKLNFPISQGADNSRDRHRYMQAMADIQAIREMPSVAPQEPQSFKWCDTCKEYDHEKHCCHRWSKVIRDTVAEIGQEPKTGEWIEHFDESGKWYECDQCHTDWGGAVNFCPNCGADMRG